MSATGVKTHSHQQFKIARMELFDSARKQWLQMVGILFFVICIAVSYFGLAGTQFTSLRRTTISLLNLMLFILPLISMLIGAISIAGNRDSLEFFLSQPLKRREFFLGKYIGLATTLLIWVVFGFGGSGLVLASKTGSRGLTDFLILMVLSYLLSLAFLSISFLISAIVMEKSLTTLSVIVMWLWFTLFYDLVVIGLMRLIQELPVKSPMLFMLLLNPVDIARSGFLINSDMAGLLGPTGAFLNKMAGTPLGLITLAAGLLLWIIVPLVIGTYIFSRRDI
ncbi:MAG: ABC transporter permease subunit [bacterium]|nr:ABC transporter permease subunit [bacterium]